jgi:hypothetical protein
VLLPDLVCREVLAAVNVLGAAAVFYPVSRSLSPVDADAFVPARAVVAVNYFGFAQELEPFRQYCARTGAALIEDNAHGFMSRDADGRLLGGRGDAGMFSFRKTIPVPNGGALVLSQGRRLLHEPLPQESMISPHHRLKQVVRRAAGQAGPVATVRAIAAVRSVTARAVGASPRASEPDLETKIPLAPNPPALVTRELRVSAPEVESERRRELYEMVGRVLGAAGATAVFSRLPSGTVPFGFPVFATGPEGAALSAHLARNGLLLSRWPDLPTAVAPAAPEHCRNLWVVPFLW